ncbi:MAG TPA: PilN domain-containing protein [Gaiellaceae bacterium]|nr:PilN domain-containing protein [Gaiellaceae bacterium]
MRAVNLLPRDVQQTRADGGRAPLFIAAGGLAAVTAASVVMFLGASGSVADQRAQLDSVEAAIAEIPERPALAVAPGVVAQERTERTSALSAALATRVPVDRLLGQLAYVLPEDAWLTALSATVPADGAGAAAATSPAAQGVSIVGATDSHASVARVLSRLAAVPTLDDVRLTGSARVVLEQPTGTSSKPVKKTVYTFTIGANLRLGGSA